MQHNDLSRQPVLPCMCMGPLQFDGFPTDKVCDFWLGPAGDSVYHFHDPYPQDAIGGVGRPLVVHKWEEIDPGFAFVFVRPSNPVWHRPVLMSVADALEGAALYLGNGPCPGGPFREIPEDKENLYSAVRQYLTRKDRFHPVEISIKIDSDQRFLGKLALGIGSLLLAPAFLTSADAKRLRDFMWAKDASTRALSIFAVPLSFKSTNPPSASLLDGLLVTS